MGSLGGQLVDERALGLYANWNEAELGSPATGCPAPAGPRHTPFADRADKSSVAHVIKPANRLVYRASSLGTFERPPARPPEAPEQRNGAEGRTKRLGCAS